jgi:acyl-CoA reductase-like NAD-dependent aldehyde dehydrogenase
MTSPSSTQAARTADAPSGFAEIDAAVERVAAHKETWVTTAIPQRIELLRRCLAGILEVAEDWVRDMVAVKMNAKT